jgi:predicted secreted hydrolase
MKIDMKFKLVSFGLVLLVSLSSQANEWQAVKPGDTVRLPKDFFYQPGYRVQWWYFTGHLFTETGREFGYELSLFAAGVQKNEYKSVFGVRTIYLSHIAVTDVQEKHFLHQERADSGSYELSGAERKQLKVWVDGDSLSGTPRRMHITGRAGDAAFDLMLVPEKPVVLNGQQGYSRKSVASAQMASLYFSYTALKTTGRLRIGSVEHRVTGKSWFDRELFSEGLGKSGSGWDWFALQLDDGREIMLYHLRKKDGNVDSFSSGTVVARDGTYRHLTVTDFTIRATASYRSEHTGIRYPSSWDIEVPSELLRLTVTPLIQDQEFLAPGISGNAYWEGTCSIEGSSRGRAYAELTGY